MDYRTPLSRYPGYLAYPSGPVTRGDIPVPNAAQCFWPQGQFAPEFLPAGSGSTPPFYYPDRQPVPGYGAIEGEEEETWVDEWRPILMFVAGVSVGYILATKPWK
jgi:hypothetical protein